MKAWWIRMARYALPYKRGLAVVMLFMLTGVVLDVLKPWPLKLIIDYALTDQPQPEAVSWLVLLPGGSSSTGLLAWMAGSTILLFIAARAVQMTQAYLMSGVGNRMVYHLGAALFEHLQRLSLRFHNQQRTGDLVQRVMTDCQCVRDLVAGAFLPLFTSLVTLVVMFGVMWQLDPFLSLIALLAAPPLGVVIKLFAGPMTERSYQKKQVEGEMMALAEQTLTALPVVQAFNREEYEDQRFRQMSRRTIKAYLHSLAAELQFSVSTSAVTALGTAAIMIIGGFHVLSGTLTIGSLLVFLAYLSSLYAPMKTLAYLSSGVATAAAGARRVLEVMDSEEGVRETPDAHDLPAPTCGHLQLDHVTFGYEPGRPVLHDICLDIQPGETIALVGATGAGKTTLVSLLPRFFDPWQGRVIFDGHDVRSLTLESLRRQVALVLQEPFLLPLSVAENIVYGRPGASRAEVVAAARAANAEEFIVDLPEGYDTVLGERGATLSGGQRQRLSIARALLKDAPVLILDEPTSALDVGTEALLMEALDRLMVGRTVFVIAHRLTTVQRADRIIVLDNGEMKEEWTHEELIGADGSYHGLHELQFALVTAGLTE